MVSDDQHERHLISVPDPKPNPAQITFSIAQSDICAGWGLEARLEVYCKMAAYGGP